MKSSCFLHGILRKRCVQAFIFFDCILFFFLIAEEPDLSNLVVSNITSDRFSLSWQTREKEFERFIVEVRESALPSQAMGRTLPGDVRSTIMTGLKASTSYNIKLYASEDGRKNTQPLLAVATTGIPGTLQVSDSMCAWDKVTQKPLSSLVQRMSHSWGL